MIGSFAEFERATTRSGQLSAPSTWLPRFGGKLRQHAARRYPSANGSASLSIAEGRCTITPALVERVLSEMRYGRQCQRALWQDHVRLDDGFWRSLKEHPVPVREEAVRAIGARSLALDVYIWLAYRLHSLMKPTPVTWAALHAQFGAGFKAVRQLKPTFREALMLALAVYPEAKVDIEASGVVLHPSAPAVPRIDAKRLGLG